MLRYLAQRIATAVPTLIGVSLVTFALLHMVPGGPVVAMLGMAASNPAAVEAVTKQLGLDQPIWEQYAIWLKRAVSGNFGMSTEFHVPSVH